MRALSIKQPWAFLITHGAPLTRKVDLGEGRYTIELSGKVILKNIENRSRPLPLRMVGQRIAVHAGQRFDNDALVWLMDSGLVAPMVAIMGYSRDIPRGGLIGEVTLVGCVTESKNPWFTGPYGWTLADPLPYDKPVPCKGRLGFFEPEIAS